MPNSPFRPLAEPLPVTSAQHEHEPSATILAAGTSCRVLNHCGPGIVVIETEHDRSPWYALAGLKFQDDEPVPAPLPEPATTRTRLAAALKVATAMAADRAPVNAFEHLRDAVQAALAAPGIALYGDHECASHECERHVGAPSTGPAWLRNDLPGVFCAHHGHVLLGYLVHPATVRQTSGRA